jgi:hypothetical protein
MCDFLWERGEHRRKVGRRKLRLYACACCRKGWHLLSEERGRRWLEYAERLADGVEGPKPPQAGMDVLRIQPGNLQRDADHAAWQATAGGLFLVVHSATANMAVALSAEAHRQGRSHESGWRINGPALLREIFGNPFRPVRLPPAWKKWNGGAIPRLAQAAYEERRLPEGTLEPARLAVLADALEEAGADAALLEHLRGPGPHVRGCWALDLCLGLG